MTVRFPAFGPWRLPPPAMERPVVVIGAGSAGQQVVRELARCDPTCPVIWYARAPRIDPPDERLPGVMGGLLNAEDFVHDDLPQGPVDVIRRHGCSVLAVNPEQRILLDANGTVQAYSDLVLATGSQPRVPTVPGIELPGVYRLRTQLDAQRLLARTARSRQTVILGGGMLGLELAQVMQRGHTAVTVVEQGPHLIPHQLDREAAECLREHLLHRGVQVLLANTVVEVLGQRRVEGVRLANGRVLQCDTLTLAAGMQPAVELARAAGLVVNRGVQVNDHMETSDPHIFAVGDCAEHGGRVYGAVEPAREQATVAAQCILRGRVSYRGSVPGSSLEILGRLVCTEGQANEMGPGLSVYRYALPITGVYRKLVLNRGTLVGMIAVGPWLELDQVRAAVRRGSRLWPWQIRRFLRNGLVWQNPVAPPAVAGTPRRRLRLHTASPPPAAGPTPGAPG